MPISLHVSLLRRSIMAGGLLPFGLGLLHLDKFSNDLRCYIFYVEQSQVTLPCPRRTLCRQHLVLTRSVVLLDDNEKVENCNGPEQLFELLQLNFKTNNSTLTLTLVWFFQSY